MVGEMERQEVFYCLIRDEEKEAGGRTGGGGARGEGGEQEGE